MTVWNFLIACIWNPFDRIHIFDDPDSFNKAGKPAASYDDLCQIPDIIADKGLINFRVNFEEKTVDILI